MEYHVENRKVDYDLIEVFLNKNIDCNFTQIINNMDKMKKIAKENYDIID